MVENGLPEALGRGSIDWPLAPTVMSGRDARCRRRPDSRRTRVQLCGTATYRDIAAVTYGHCMRVLAAVSRALLGWLFVHAGFRVLRKPGPAAAASAPTLALMRKHIPGLPGDITVVRANATVHVLAGSMLIAGSAPHGAALTLAGSLVPTTVAGHAFWTISDPVARRQQRAHFDKNVAIFGGLLAAAVIRSTTSSSPKPRG
jgi:putative oxidoreductase